MGGDLYGTSSAKYSDQIFTDEDYEQFESTSVNCQSLAVIKPENLRLQHRIGRGYFGDVWLATLHSSNADFDEFHEVAAKVLPAVDDHYIRKLITKLEHISNSSRDYVCWPRGITTKDGKACAIMNLYEGSIGDKMARLVGNRLPLSDVLRYAIDIVHGILRLHAHDILALNLKPCNLLLDDRDQAVVGEFGLPFLLLDAFSSSGPLVWLGTPNYMAPEQWDACLRGPITFETDAWGFACSILEMLTGAKPWDQMSPTDIFKLVVVRREKPTIPSGLPHAIQRVLKECFEYDYRRRPTFSDILSALSSPNSMFKEGDWICVLDYKRSNVIKIGLVKKLKGPESFQVQFCDKPGELIECYGSSRITLWKNSFQIGDCVCLKPSVVLPRFRWHPSSHDAEAVIVGVEEDAAFMVKFGESPVLCKADPIELERVCSGVISGDWVRMCDGWAARSETDEHRRPSLVGIVHNLRRDGKVDVAFLGQETLWTAVPDDFVKVAPFRAGQFIRLRADVMTPRFEWPFKKGHGWETGRIAHILPNGCLVVNFPGHLWNGRGWWADPEEAEVICMNDYTGWLEKYQHLQAKHWAIGPTLYLLGFLAVARVGTVLGGFLFRPMSGKGKNIPTVPAVDKQKQIIEYQPSTTDPKAMWLPPAVANMFKEGITSS